MCWPVVCPTITPSCRTSGPRERTLAKFIVSVVAGLVLVAGIYIAANEVNWLNEKMGVPYERPDVEAMKRDLTAIAKAETEYMKNHMMCAPVEYLIEIKAVNVPTKRGSYVYSVKPKGDSFVVEARSPRPPGGSPRALIVDESLRVSQE